MRPQATFSFFFLFKPVFSFFHSPRPAFLLVAPSYPSLLPPRPSFLTVSSSYSYFLPPRPSSSLFFPRPALSKNHLEFVLVHFFIDFGKSITDGPTNQPTDGQGLL